MKASVSRLATISPIEGSATGSAPEFGEIADVQRLYGLRRTTTFNLIREGQIKSVLLRKPGNKSGKRLVYLPSVREWLLKQMEATG